MVRITVTQGTAVLNNCLIASHEPVEIFGPTNSNQAVSPSQFGKHTNFVVSFKLCTYCHSPYSSNNSICVQLISKRKQTTLITCYYCTSLTCFTQCKRYYLKIGMDSFRSDDNHFGPWSVPSFLKIRTPSRSDPEVTRDRSTQGMGPK